MLLLSISFVILSRGMIVFFANSFYRLGHCARNSYSSSPMKFFNILFYRYMLDYFIPFFHIMKIIPFEPQFYIYSKPGVPRFIFLLNLKGGSKVCAHNQTYEQKYETFNQTECILRIQENQYYTSGKFS